MHVAVDGTGIDATAVTGAFGDIQSFVTGTVAPLLFGLALAAIAITLGLKYVRKGARQS